jgi:hypothetical protein
MIELHTSHSDFHELHEAAKSDRGKWRKIQRDLLIGLLMDHSSMVLALRGQVKEPK